VLGILPHRHLYAQSTVLSSVLLVMLQCNTLCRIVLLCSINDSITCMCVGQEGRQLLLPSQLLYQNMHRTAAYTIGALDELRHSTAAVISFECAAVVIAVLHSKVHC
jgi:hypothetical protein